MATAIKSTSKPLTAGQQKLVEENMLCVKILAARLRGKLPRHVMLEDLVSAGNLGLVECASRFDGRCKFTTFASKRIIGAMIDYLRRQDLLTRSERRNQGDAIERTEVQIDNMVHAIPESNRNVVRLEADIDVRRLIGRLRLLNPRRAFVVDQYFLHGRTLVDIGRNLGIQGSRACQLRSEGMAKIRLAA